MNVGCINILAKSAGDKNTEYLCEQNNGYFVWNEIDVLRACARGIACNYSVAPNGRVRLNEGKFKRFVRLYYSGKYVVTNPHKIILQDNFGFGVGVYAFEDSLLCYEYASLRGDRYINEYLLIVNDLDILDMSDLHEKQQLVILFENIERQFDMKDRRKLTEYINNNYFSHDYDVIYGHRLYSDSFVKCVKEWVVGNITDSELCNVARLYDWDTHWCVKSQKAISSLVHIDTFGITDDSGLRYGNKKCRKLG
jgi:hypothetical protein